MFLLKKGQGEQGRERKETKKEKLGESNKKKYI